MSASGVEEETSQREHVTGSILVADDDPINRMLLRDLLESEGHSVQEASDGYEALRAAAFRPDAILLDVMMPHMDGFEVCRQLKRDPNLASIPVIIVTSLADRRDRLTGIEAGANDFLTKPLDTHEVALRVRNAVYQHGLYTQLQESHEQMNHLFGMATHDMLNPLGVIRTYSALLLNDKSALPEQIATCLMTIDRSSAYLLRLVTELLDVSRIESGKLVLNLEPCDLVPLLRGVIDLNRVLADRKAIKLEFDGPESLDPVLVDSAKIEQVFNNLVGNAIKVSPEHSTVRVSLKAEGGSLLVTIVDAGPVIPQADLDQIFQPFSAATAKGLEGELQTGLGLAIAEKVVRGHGGSIRVEPADGQGNRFVLSLPQRMPGSSSKAGAAPPKLSAESR